jgi:RNase P subunit RPR2
MTVPVMDMAGIVCAGCDLPILEGEPYSQELVAADLVVIVCTTCGGSA